ncbi:hypothetical protein XMIN_3669 [Xanthomonas citri pv. mangiferaeindicae LMG 941]|nr:hypothetical protein XMIN_3669 [Xanthomonas citri pv. mangiferaeindicae LMG 941]
MDRLHGWSCSCSGVGSRSLCRRRCSLRQCAAGHSAAGETGAILQVVRVPVGGHGVRGLNRRQRKSRWKPAAFSELAWSQEVITSWLLLRCP